LTTNILILLQIGTSDPWGERMIPLMRSSLGSAGHRSGSCNTKVRGLVEVSFSTLFGQTGFLVCLLNFIQLAIVRFCIHLASKAPYMLATKS